MKTARQFQVGQIWQNTFTRGDLLILGGLAVVIYFGARLAFAAPAVVTGPTISLAASALPWYAALSIMRMGAAYGLWNFASHGRFPNGAVLLIMFAVMVLLVGLVSEQISSLRFEGRR